MKKRSFNRPPAPATPVTAPKAAGTEVKPSTPVTPPEPRGSALRLPEGKSPELKPPTPSCAAPAPEKKT